MRGLSTGAKVAIGFGVGALVGGLAAVAAASRPEPRPTLDAPCPDGCTPALVALWAERLSEQIDDSLDAYNAKGWASVDPLPAKVASAVGALNKAADLLDSHKSGELPGDATAQVQALVSAIQACMTARLVFLSEAP